MTATVASPGFTLPAGGNLDDFIAQIAGSRQVGYLTGGSYAITKTLGLQRGDFTLDSLDRTKPATVAGRAVLMTGANGVTLQGLKLDGRNAGGLPSPTIGSDSVTIQGCDITNYATAIGVNIIDSSADHPDWGTAHNAKILRNHIHDCGPTFTAYPGTAGVPVAQTNGYYCHGVYAIGYNTEVSDNVIEGNANRGVQLRGSHGAHVHHNLIRDNGCGIVFGDLSASGNLVEQNAIIGNGAGVQNPGRHNAFGVFSWWGPLPAGIGNQLVNNYLALNHIDLDTSGGGFVASGNVIGTSRTFDATLYGPRSASPSPPPPAPSVNVAAALASTGTAISELELTDAWKLYHSTVGSHTYKSHAAMLATRSDLGG